MNRLLSFSMFFYLLTLCVSDEENKYRPCPICYDEDIYPSESNIGKMVNVRYAGTFTCGGLYQAGMDGGIPEFVCGALQDWVQDVCGCDPSNKPPSQYKPPTQAPWSIPPQYSHLPIFSQPIWQPAAAPVVVMPVAAPVPGQGEYNVDPAPSPTNPPAPAPTNPPAPSTFDFPIRRTPTRGGKEKLKADYGRLGTRNLRMNSRMNSEGKPLEVEMQN